MGQTDRQTDELQHIMWPPDGKAACQDTAREREREFIYHNKAQTTANQ